MVNLLLKVELFAMWNSLAHCVHFCVFSQATNNTYSDHQKKS